MGQFPSMKAKRLMATLERKPLGYALRAKLARIAAWKHRTDHR
jgi:hypothetical protein